MPDSLQRVLAVVAGILSLPLTAALAIAVKLDSPGPAVYASRRVGEGGREFTCLKLRTMAWQPRDTGSRVTHGADPRVTRIGRLLRGTRLDELPQLWNVARGEMRLVGPRPEDPAFVDLTVALHREVFTARPGITGLAQLLHVDEAQRLDAEDPERHYRDVIQPAKLRIDAAYLRHRTPTLDLWILAQTPLAMFGRRFVVPSVLRAALSDDAASQADTTEVNAGA